jgi:hypothetical protein
MRRSARNQSLPDNEVLILRSLYGDGLYSRCRRLFQAGWTLRAIGEAFEPAKSRSTLHTWINQAADIRSRQPSDNQPVPTPTLLTPREYVPKRPPSPGISAVDRENIRTLAPLARKYRSRMHHGHSFSQANQSLTLLCQGLYEDGVPIQELADTAGVTYRAMAKRVGKVE